MPRMDFNLRKIVLSRPTLRQTGNRRGEVQNLLENSKEDGGRMMNADTAKIIEICKDPKVQELVRRCYPNVYYGYATYHGLDAGHVNIANYESDYKDLFFLPVGFDEERCCSQVDVLIAEKERMFSPVDNKTIDFDEVSFRFDEFKSRLNSLTGYDPSAHSDLYLKFCWLSELLKEGRR